MKTSITILLTTLLLSGFSSPDNAAHVPYVAMSPLGEWAATCVSPCRLPEEYQGGGEIDFFLAAALILEDQGKSLIVDTPVCASACTMLVDELDFRGVPVCVSQKTRMGYHLTSITKVEDGTHVRFEAYEYRNRVLEYHFLKLGGLPKDGSFEWISAPFGMGFLPFCHPEP